MVPASYPALPSVPKSNVIRGCVHAYVHACISEYLQVIAVLSGFDQTACGLPWQRTFGGPSGRLEVSWNPSVTCTDHFDSGADSTQLLITLTRGPALEAG